MHLRRAVLMNLLLCACLAGVASAQRTHVLIVTGIPGEDRFAAQWRAWSERLAGGLIDAGVARADVVRLGAVAGSGVTGRSTKEEIGRHVLRIAGDAAASDQVLFVIFAHGSGTPDEVRINLPGPDLSAADLAAMLQAFPTQRLVIVNAASASGPFVERLAGENRVVIAATRSAAQNNVTVFGEYFSAAYAGGSADTDKDGRVSLLEAFTYTQREVERTYSSTNRMRPEHALLDADGDGTGTVEPDARAGDGRVASTIYFGAPATAAATAPTGASAELRALYERRAELQQQVEAHRARRDSMSADAYERELERLLVGVATATQEIRRLEGGGT